VIAPDTDLLEPVSGFEARVRGEELLFTWAVPGEEKRLGIRGYKVFAEDADAVRESRCNCREFRDLAYVELDRLDENGIKEGRMELRLPVSPAHLGKTFHYIVVPINRKGFAGHESGEVSIHWIRPPAPPVDLVTEPGDRSVLLKWQPGGRADRQWFNIYRRTDRGTFPLEPLNETPVSENRFLDGGVQNNSHYYYQVRASASDRPPWIESRSSTEVVAVPLDRTPPAPPIGLEAIPGSGIVRLFWDENKEKDISGYRLLYSGIRQCRSAESERPIEKDNR
jgi:hypothetical protein